MCTVLQDKWYKYFIPPVLHICYILFSSCHIFDWAIIEYNIPAQVFVFAESSYSQLYLAVINDW